MTRPAIASLQRPARSLILLLALATLSACGGGGSDGKNGAGDSGPPGDTKEDKPVPVEVAQVSRRPISASYHGTAALEAPNEAQVVAKTSGVLLQLMAEEGDKVSAGQVLARLDKEEGIVIGELDPARINDVRASLPALEHRVRL